jgi:U3 small nucleolar RNA-associated protein 10
LESGQSVRSSDAYTIFVDRSLVPSLGSLAVAMKHHMLWKPLNHALMMKTRSSVASVRLSSLKVLFELFNRLQQQYLVLLPETLPYISELMEDQDTDVEEMTQRVIKQIEDLSGESLENHLK